MEEALNFPTSNAKVTELAEWLGGLCPNCDRGHGFDSSVEAPSECFDKGTLLDQGPGRGGMQLVALDACRTMSPVIRGSMILMLTLSLMSGDIPNSFTSVCTSWV